MVLAILSLRRTWNIGFTHAHPSEGIMILSALWALTGSNGRSKRGARLLLEGYQLERTFVLVCLYNLNRIIGTDLLSDSERWR